MHSLILWLYWIPSWVLGVLIFAVFSTIATAGLLTFRGWMRRHVHRANDLVFNFVAIAGIVYALAVGLIAVATWDKFKAVQEIVNAEAYSLNNLYSDASGLPTDSATMVRNEIRGYLDFVLKKEWPSQQHGSEAQTKVGDDLAQGILQDVVYANAKTPHETVLLAQALGELNTFLAKRRAREGALNEALPGVLYFLVLGGAAILIFMTYALWTEEFWLQIAMTLALSAMISLVIFMIVSMDHPLWGPVSASPEAFENVLKAIQRQP